MPLTRRSDSLRRCLPLAFLSACFAPAGSAWAQTPVPSGGEFQVNTYTTSRQRYASVSGVGTAGDFVVAWRDDTQDGSGAGIFGQRFASDGIPQGSEFQVNSYTTGSQTLVSVSGVGTAGDFVMAWLEGGGHDGAGLGVFGQRFASDGTPQGSEFQVNSYTTGSQTLVSVSGVGTAGDFVVAWNSPHDGSCCAGIFGQRFASDGTRQSSEFQVTSYTTNNQTDPSVSGVGTAGDFVVAWQSFSQDGSSAGVFGQRFASDGTLQGSDFQVNSYTTSGQGGPSVSGVGTAGDFVVAWRDQGAQDGDSSGIFGQRFTSDGTPQGSEFQVNTYTTSNQGRTSVAGVGTTGDFVVTWFSSGQDGSGYGVFGQRFASDGTPQGSEFQVNSHTASTQTAPSVAELGTAGDFVVAWHSAFQDGYQDGVFGQRFARPATVTVTAPVATKQNFGVGSEQRIRAEHDLGSAATFDVAISRDYGSSFSDIGTGVASASNGTAMNLNWTVTDGGQSTPQPGSQVRVTSVTPVAGASDTTVIFTIDSDSINVRRPRNNVATGVAFKIVWLHNIGYRRPFQIELSRDDGNNFTETIASSTLSQWAWRGQFFWTPSGGCSTTCVVRVTSLDPVATTGDSVTFNIV